MHACMHACMLVSEFTTTLNIPLCKLRERQPYSAHRALQRSPARRGRPVLAAPQRGPPVTVVYVCMNVPASTLSNKHTRARAPRAVNCCLCTELTVICH